MLKTTATLGMASLMAATTQAASWADLNTAVQAGNWADAHAEIGQLIEDYGLTSRHSVQAKRAADMRRLPQLTKAQRHDLNAIHHRTLATRDKLGMTKFGDSPTVGQDFASLNTFSGFVLNIVAGMSYDANSSSCYDRVEDIVILTDTLSDIVRKLYKPAYLSEFQVVTQDYIAQFSAVYLDCKIDKVIYTVSHITSSEGQSELTARVAGALPFEINTCIEVYQNPEKFSTQEKGQAYGACVSKILNWEF